MSPVVSPASLDRRKSASAILLGLVVAAIIIFLAQLYTVVLHTQISAALKDKPSLVTTLQDRDLVAATPAHFAGDLHAYWHDQSAIGPLPLVGSVPLVTHLDNYVQSALTINSESRGSLGSENTKSPEPIDVCWISALFGFEQYICFFLAGFCWAELRSLRMRIQAEESFSDASKDFYKDPNSGAQPLTSATAQNASSTFVKEIDSNLYSKSKAGLDGEEFITFLRHYYWVDAVISSSHEFTRSGDRTAALKEGESTLEAGRAKFEGGFYIEQYLQWAIPGIGFIGTIRGISGAMGAAEVADDLPIVVAHLGVAFNSTLTALLISLVLMAKRHAVLNKGEEVFSSLKQLLRDRVYAQYTP